MEGAAKASRTAALPGTSGSQTIVAEDEVEHFLTLLRSGDVDKKVNLIQLWGLKLETASDLPERTIDAITLVVAPFVRSSSHLLLTSTLSSFLPAFLPLIPSSYTQSHLRVALSQLLPGLAEKLGDPKDKIHSAARECLVGLGRKVYESDAQPPRGKEKDSAAVVWEGAVKDVLAGRSARAKVESLRLILQLRSDASVKIPLKPWLPVLVDLLEDSDGAVRDSSRETVVALLAPVSTPAAARTQLKTLMVARNVRKSIADAIINRVLGGGSGGQATAIIKDDKSEQSRSGLATPADEIEVVYIASAADLHNEFRAMSPHFAGKETEHNWGPRERSVLRIRGMLRGRVFSNQPEAFLAGLKGELTEGIAKTLMSLRTTVAQQSCSLVQELAEYLGPSFDPCAESLLPVLARMAGLTKRIIADKSQAGVTAIFKHSTISPRTLAAHAGAAVLDKSVHTRQYGLGHLRTLLEYRAGKHTASVESIPGMAKDIEHFIRRGLGDTNPQVREQARTTFWCYNRVWPREGTALLESLDGVARKQLEKADPKLSAAAAAEPKPIPKKPRASSAMSAMLAAKRAEAAQLAAQRSATASPQDEFLPTSPVKASMALPQSDMKPSEAPNPNEHPSKLEQRETSLHADSVPSAISNALVPPRAMERENMTRSISTPARVDEARRSTPAASPKGSESARRIQPPVLTSPKAIPRRHVASSVTSSKSGPPSLGRTLSRSPPSHQGQTHIPIRQGGHATIARSPAVSHPHTPSKSHGPNVKSGLTSYITPRHHSSSSIQRMREFNDHSWESAVSVAQRSPGDPAEEARRAQAAQGISAAEQLLDYDDDQVQVSVPPMTPLRHNLNSFSTPLPSRLQTNAWEDSPKAVTPKLMKQLQSRPHERTWWNERRNLLRASLAGDDDHGTDIQEAIENLRRGTSTVAIFQQIAAFSSENAIDPLALSDFARNKSVWSDNQTFERLLDGLLEYLLPSQPVQLLEHALVVLWEVVQNQWCLLESREDDLLDALFRLRTSANSIVLESTNAMLSLLTDVCDPPFLLLLLHAALTRYLVALDADDSSNQGDITGDRAKAAGYNYGLNAMGMSILRLPKEAVEVEASRLEPHVMKALSLTAQDCVPARQAANRVILAIQCMLEDDTRTLALFPSLDRKQRAFVTYLMEQNGILHKPAASPVPRLGGRQTIHHELVDGLARGSRIAR